MTLWDVTYDDWQREHRGPDGDAGVLVAPGVREDDS